MKAKGLSRQPEEAAMRREYVSLLLLVLLFSIGTPYSVDAQTCLSNVPRTAPAARFTDNGDGTVSDTQTGLMWIRCAEGLSGGDCFSGRPTALQWGAALIHAESRIYATHEDWRLPNIKELASIVELACVTPAIDTQVFVNALPACFWSSSPQTTGGANAADGANALGVCFNTGDDFSDFRTNTKYVWLVRDTVITTRAAASPLPVLHYLLD